MSDFQISIRQQVYGVDCFNVTNWILPDNTSTTLQEVCDGIRASLATYAQGHMAGAWVFKDCTFREFDGAPPFSTIVAPTLGDLTGTNGGTAMPRQSTLLVSTSANASKPNRGRLYWSGVGVGDWFGTGWDPTAITDFTDMVDAWQTGITTTAQPDAVLRIARPNFGTNVWTAQNDITAVTAANYAKTVRRRENA